MSKKKNQFSKPNKEEANPNSFMRFSGLAFEMLAFMFLGVFVGHKLDEYYKLEFPIFIIVGSVLGFAGSLIYVIRKLPKE